MKPRTSDLLYLAAVVALGFVAGLVAGLMIAHGMWLSATGVSLTGLLCAIAAWQGGKVMFWNGCLAENNWQREQMRRFYDPAD